MQKRRKAHSTLIYLVLGFLPLASSFLLTPVYTQFLSPDEYGIIALAAVLQTWLSLIVSLSLDAAFSRFYFSNPDDSGKTSELLSTTVLIIALLTLLTSILLYLFGESIMRALFNESLFSFSRFGWPVLITAAFGMTYNVISLYYRDAENLRSFSMLAVTYFILLTACTFYGVVVAEAGAAGSIYGKMTGTVITMSIFLLYLFSKTKPRFNRQLSSKMIGYSMPLFLYGLMAAAFDTMDRFFLSRYFDLSVIGKYNFAFVIVSVIGIVIASYQSAVNPSIYRMMLDKTEDFSMQLNDLMKKFVWTGIFFATVCIVIAWVLIIFFINPQYHESLKFIPLLSLSFIPRAYYIVFSFPLFTENKTKVLPFINALSVIAGIVANLLLIPVLSIYGIVISVFIIKLVQALGALFFINKYRYNHPAIFSMGDVHLTSILFAAFALAATAMDFTHYYYPHLLSVMLFTITLIVVKKNKPALYSLLNSSKK